MNNQTNFTWSYWRVELLKKLWADGLSASQIGAALGVSRNSVIGKCHRLGLSLGVSTMHKSSSKTRKPRASRSAPFKAPKAEPIAPPMEPDWQQAALVGLEFDAAIPRHQLKHISELGEFHCKFIIGEPSELTYCGGPIVDGYSWCIPHFRRCFQPANRPRTQFIPTRGTVA